MGMKRVVIVVVVLAVVIGGAIGALALTRLSSPTGTVDAVQTTEPAPADTPEAAPTADPVPGTYVDYTDTAIAEAEGRVVLFFHAPWCSQCLQLEEGIVTDGVPDGVTIIKVDWDTHQDLEAQYGVPMRTTFVELDDAGEVVQRLTAYDDPRFETVVETMNL